MQIKRFLRSVVAHEGWYCVFAANRAGQRKQKFYETIDHVMDAARDFDANGYDAYYALATFGEAGSRKKEDALKMRSFFMDLDCGPSKEFPTQLDAIKALRKFCKQMKLPRPITVNSGRGVHVYWPLSEDVTVSEWEPVAERLKALCAKHNFDADPAVTADIARILRVPETHNYKSDPPAPVEIFGLTEVQPIDFDTFSELLGADPIPVPKKFTPMSGSHSVLDALMGNRENYFKDIMVKTGKGKGCAQLAYIYKNQSTMSEPMWRAGLSIAKHCTDADKAALRISEGHPDFSPDEMYNKMDRIKGPYLCSTFDEYNPDVCTNCPLWGKIKSPISLGSRTREATEEDNIIELSPVTDTEEPETYIIPTYPKPFFRGANGGVYIRTENADGDTEDKCIYHNDLYIVRRVTDGDQDMLVFRLHLPKDGVREFTVPQIAVTSKDEFRKAIGSKGVTAWGSNLEALMSYSIRWIEELQHEGAAEVAHVQFGWSDDEGSSFILGDREIFPDRIDFNPASTATAFAFPFFTPKGSLEGWKENANFFNKRGMELYQLVVCAGFGSVLMRTSHLYGCLLHLHSKDSGLGKTTAMNMALTPWGNPEDLVLKERDSLNSRMNRAEVYKNLPFPTDEITNTAPKLASDTAYGITEGSQRNRMSGGANVERARGGTWRFLAISTGQMSLIEKISLYKNAPKGEALRVLEARVDKFFSSTGDKAMTDEFSNRAKKHYGQAGVVFVQYYMNNKEAVAQIEAKVRKRVDEACNMQSSERFWSEYITKALTAGIVANKIGLLTYDMAEVFKFAVQLVKHNQMVVQDMSASSSQTLADFFAEHNGNILSIKSTSDLRGTTQDGIESLVIPEMNPRTKLVARYETDTKKAFILVKPFKRWCIEQQIDYTACVSDLIKEKGAVKRKMRITKGTNLNLPAADVIEVNFELEHGGSDEGNTED